jgi:hypothetical protein
MMADKYEGLQQDCLDLIKKCNAMILLARRCRTACIMSDPVTVKACMDEIRAAGAELGEFAYGFAPSYFDIDTGA